MQASLTKNQKFGALTVIEYSTSNKGWKCICNCNKIVYRNSTDLKETKHPSCGCERNIKSLLSDRLSLKRSIILAYKVNATKKNLTVDLTEDQFLSFFIKNCFYCDSPPSNKVRTRKRKGRIHRPERDQSFIYSGIDRIDSKLGYTLENCVPCCYICNTSKNDMQLDDWKQWIQKVYSKTFNDYAKAVGSSDPKRETPPLGG